LETLVDIILGMSAAAVVIIFFVGGYMILFGGLSVGGSVGREWRNQAEQNARNRVKDIHFTRSETQQYINQYGNNHRNF
jgi:hypothetical protein